MLESNEKSQAPPIYDNSLYRRWIVRPLAIKLAPWFVSAGFTGNRVCWLKLVFGLGGAFILATRYPLVCLLGMMFLQLSFFLDATDGEVARLRGEAAKLSGEFLDKLFDHLPKTAMYFFWGYGTFLLTGSHLPLFCGTFMAAWSIYPRFCGVETLLERLDKAPDVYAKAEFHRAVGESFVVKEERGRTDFFLTLFVHPAMNVLTIFFVLEIIWPEIAWADQTFETRSALLLIFVLIGLLNFIRKSIKFFRALDFS